MLKADLTGKRALVTGSASGIGFGCVTMLASMGATVALNHLPGDKAGPKQVAALQAQGYEIPLKKKMTLNFDNVDQLPLKVGVQNTRPLRE